MLGTVGDKIYWDDKHIANLVYDAKLKLFLIHYDNKEFRSAIEKEVLRKLDNYISNKKESTLNENIDMTKNELKKFIQDIFNDEFKKEEKKKPDLTKADIKEIVRKMLENQYKFLWDKRSFWSKNI